MEIQVNGETVTLNVTITEEAKAELTKIGIDAEAETKKGIEQALSDGLDMVSTG